MNAVKKARFLSFAMLRRSPCLIPLAFIPTFHLWATIPFCIYSMFKLDVILDHKQKLPPWERMDLANPKIMKLLVINEKCQPNPELQRLKKEISEHYA